MNRISGRRDEANAAQGIVRVGYFYLWEKA